MRGLMCNQGHWPPGGGSGGGSPQEEVTAATAAAAAAATVSQELSPFGQAPGPSCPGTKYPVRGIPHFDQVRVHRIEESRSTKKKPVLDIRGSRWTSNKGSPKG